MSTGRMISCNYSHVITHLEMEHKVPPGHIYTRCYVAIVTSYGSIARHYSDVASARANGDANTTSP